MQRGHFDRLGTQDSSFIYFEQLGSHMHVSAVALFDRPPLARPDGGLDVEAFRAYVASRLPLLPRYRQRLDQTPLQGHPVWVDDPEFRLSYHVRHTALPKPGDREQLLALAGRIVSQQLDRTKPLWEMWAVEGLEDGRFALISKVHHCMTDGASGVGMLGLLFGLEPSDEIEPAPAWTPRPAPRRIELLGEDLAHAARAPLTGWRHLRRSLSDPKGASLVEEGRALLDALRSGLRAPPEAPFNRPIGTHRRIEFCDLELGRVKELGKRLGGTVNDVVLGTVTGALRHFLADRRELVPGSELRVVVPVDMRVTAEEESGNHVAAWFLSLPVGETDPGVRFAKIRERTDRARRSGTARGIEIFTRLAESTGSDLVTALGVWLASAVRPYNLIVTNVRGPAMPLYLLDARLEALYPQLPLFAHQGLGVAVMSYLDRVSVGLVADWDVVPDLADLSEAFPGALRELEQVAGVD